MDRLDDNKNIEKFDSEVSDYINLYAIRDDTNFN